MLWLCLMAVFKRCTVIYSHFLWLKAKAVNRSGPLLPVKRFPPNWLLPPRPKLRPTLWHNSMFFLFINGTYFSSSLAIDFLMKHQRKSIVPVINKRRQHATVSDPGEQTNQFLSQHWDKETWKSSETVCINVNWIEGQLSLETIGREWWQAKT